MRTINLQTVYQLVITALLLGACLGLLGQRLPWLAGSSIAAMEQGGPSLSAPDARRELAATAPQNQDVMTSKNTDADVRVEVEVHSRGNANALARALGPDDTEVKVDTTGEGDGRSVAYITASGAPEWTQPVQPLLSADTEPTGYTSSSSVIASKTGSAITTVFATVTEAVVNLRSAPDLGSTVIGTAARSQQFAVVGRDASHVWWLVCCHQEQPQWVHNAVVQVTGDVTNVKVVTPPARVNASTIQAHAPTPTLAPPLPTATPPAQYEFMVVEQAQFEERIIPRIFLYVHEGDEGLGGYTLRVRKDSSNLPVTQKSIAGLPGYTWPIPNERQRSTNLKVEFPTVNPTGLWEVQLIDADGRAVGPIITFRLQPNEPNQEMYINYHKR